MLNFDTRVCFEGGKLVNGSKLDLTSLRNKEEKKEMEKEVSVEGIVKSIGRKRYFIETVLNVNKKDMEFRIYDNIGELFFNTIQIGDKITGTCIFDKKGKTGHYNKIKTFDKTNNTIIKEGVITNTNNSRDTRRENIVSFCFKPSNSKTVDFIQASDYITKSIQFKKGNKIKIEMLPQDRDVKFSNSTYTMVTFWSVD